MTRVLSFDGDRGPKRFHLLRLALLSAGDGKGPRTRDIIRKEARLLDALDTVSDPYPTKEDEDDRALKAEGGTITVSQEDFDLLSGYVDSTPWVPRISRGAVDVQDWLSAAEKVDR